METNFCEKDIKCLTIRAASILVKVPVMHCFKCKVDTLVAWYFGIRG